VSRQNTARSRPNVFEPAEIPEKSVPRQMKTAVYRIVSKGLRQVSCSVIGAILQIVSTYNGEI
jgi:hypothetical protein